MLKKNLLLYLLTLAGVFSFLPSVAQPPCNLTITTVPNPATICNGQSIVLTANSATATGYTWTPSATLSASTGSPVTATPVSTTTYTCTPAGCSGAPVTVVVTVNPTPTAAFSFTQSNPCSSSPVQFTNQSTPAAGLTYAWNFGDAGSGASNTSNSQNPSHVFSATGSGAAVNYTVTLVVTNAQGCTSSITHVVTATPSPDAAIADENVFSPFTNCQSGSGTSYTLTIDNASATTGSNTNYTINWGDGPTQNFGASLPNGTTHTYNNLGYYTIVVSVTGANGCIDTAHYTVFNGGNPSVGLGIPQLPPCICGPVTLSFPVLNVLGNTPGTSYTVTFSDAGTQTYTQANVPDTLVHTYNISSCGFTTPGGFNNAFYVKILATNPCGSAQSTVEPIRICVAPTPSFTIVPNPQCTNSAVTFTNTSVGTFIQNGNCVNTVTTNWLITGPGGTNLTSNAGTYSNSFSTPGLYTARLITGNPCGNDTLIQNFCIVAPPTAGFTLGPIGCAPTSVTTTNTSTGTGCGTLTYNWYVNSTWVSSATSPSLTFNTAGSYTICLEVSNGACPIVSTCQTITIKSPPTVTVSLVSPACGSVTANPSAVFGNGGGTITTYAWTFTGGNPSSSSSQSPGTVTYNTCGNYTISICATNECGTTCATTPVSVYCIPTANAGANQTICEGNSTTLNGSASGGTAAYSYSWSPTATLSTWWNASTTATPTTTTTYTLQVTDANGCTDNDQMVVNVNPAPNVTVNLPAPICVGQNTTLSANGAPNYTWSPSTGLSATTGASVTASPIITTTYTVTGTAGNNCTDQATVIVTVNPIPVLTINPSPATICVGGSTPLTANGASTYTWSPSTGLSATTGTTVTASPAATTTYTVFGTSAAGCTATTTVVVNVTSLPTVTATASTYTICNGQSATLTGAGATTYSWLPVTGLGSPNSQTTSASPTSTTTYTLTGTVGVGCQGIDTVVVHVLPLPNINVSANPAQICAGGSTTLTATGGFGYQWSPSTGLSQTNGNNITCTPASTITYTVTGNGANGCSNSNTIIVVVNPLPNVSVNPPAPFICLNNTQVMTASGASTYTWTPSANLSASTGATVTANPTATGTYTYTVVGTTAAGCTAQTTVQLGVNGLPNVTGNAIDYSICFGSSTTLNAAGAVNYTWTPATGLSATTGNSVTANPTSTTTYTVSGTSGLNCSDDDTVVVTVLPLPVINSNPANPHICIGESISITLNGAVNYSWSPNTNLSTTTGPTVTANPTVTTTYTVTVTGANGCTTTAQVVVNVHPLPNVNVNPNPVQLCLNSSQNLTASGGSTYVWSPNTAISSTTGNIVSINPTSNITYSVVVTSVWGCMDSTTIPVTVNTNTVAASPDYQLCLGESTTMTANNGTTYSWSPNSGLSASTGATVTASPTITTTYTATAQTTGGCFTTDTVLVIVNPIPNVGLVPGSVIQCAGVNVNLNASGASTYSWGPSAGLSATTGSSVTASPYVNTTYTVIGTDNNGCKDSAFSQITAYPLPPINAGNDITVCHTPIQVTLGGFTPQGGTWSGTGIVDPVNAVFDPMVSGLGTFTLFYDVINANGCTNHDSIHVTVTPTIWPVAGPGDTACYFDPLLVLGGNSPAGGYWSGFGIVNQNSGTFNPTLAGPGLHPVIYSIGTGQCTTSDTTFVLVQPAPNLLTNPVFPQLCIGSSVNITASGAVNYTWSPSTNISASTGATVTVNPTITTQYTLTGTSALGCSASIPVTVVVNPLPIVDAGVNQNVCLYATPFNMFGFNPVGGFWTGTGVTNGFQGTFDPMVSGVGNFIIHYTVTNTNGCTNTDSLTVNVIQPVIGNAGPDDTICNNANPINLVGFPVGGTWSGTGITNPLLGTFNPFGIPPGNYTLVYSPQPSQCFWKDSLVMTILPTPTLTLLAGSNSICAGQSTNIVASGGSTYTWSPAFSLNVATGSSVVATPAVTTTYTVNTTDASSCSVTGTIVITINPIPSVNIAPNNPTLCFGQNVNLIANGAATYSWSPAFGLNATTGSTVVASPTITTQYFVTGISAAGCSNNDSVLVTVYNLPQVTSTPVSDWICNGTSTVLNASGAISYTWSPAASLSASIGATVTATPTVTTTYTVVGVDIHGCSNSDTSAVSVYPGPVTFNNPNPWICRGDSITLVASGAATYAWAPNTGLSSGTGNTVTAYPSTTTNYSVIGTDINGCTATWPITVTVHFPVMTITPTDSICDGQSTALVSNGAVSYQWAPPAGLNTTTAATVIASPTVTTTYTLIGYDNYNCSDTLQSVVTVFPQPVADFGFTPAEGCDPVTVVFTDSSTFALNWQWTFSDGTTDSVQNPVHTFVGPGTYDVILYVSGLNNCNDQSVQNNIITVYPEPIASFVYQQSDEPVLNGLVSFYNTSINSDSWVWHFGDGDSTYIKNPSHEYKFSGDYEVMLVANNIYGCVDTTIEPVHLDFYKGLFVPNAMTPNYGPEADRLFTPKGFGLKTYHIWVFDTWGNLMWQSTKLVDSAPTESWDGTFKGVQMPQDAYVWRCEATFLDDTVWPGMTYDNGRTSPSGTVTILK